MRLHIHTLVRAAMVAAIYVVLTLLLSAVSFGPIQFRASEALTLLPAFTPSAVWGLFAGCLLANLLGGAVWYDVLLGSLATLAAALATRVLRKRPLLAALPPVFFNGAIVGPVVYLAYVRPPDAPISWGLIMGSAATVALSEAAVCCTLGLALLWALRKLPEETLRRLER